MHRPRPQADERCPTATSTTTTSSGSRSTRRPGGRASAPLLRRALRLDDVRPARHPARRARRRSCIPTGRASARCSQRLEREHGVTHYLAHNMTVTPRNLDQVAEVDPRLPRHGLPHVLLPARRLHRQHRAAGRTTTARSRPTACGRRSSAAPARGCTSGALAVRRRALQPHRLRRLRGRPLRAAARRGRPRRPALASGLHRGVRRHGLRRAARAARRAAGPRLRAPPARAAGAWPAGPGASWRERAGRRTSRATARARSRSSCTRSWTRATCGRRGRRCSAARSRPTRAIRATQERLQACSYAMAHPEDGTLVPACAQHAVLDPLTRTWRWRSCCRSVDTVRARCGASRQNGGLGVGSGSGHAKVPCRSARVWSRIRLDVLVGYALGRDRPARRAGAQRSFAPRRTRPAPAPASLAGPCGEAMPSTRIALRPRPRRSRPSVEPTSSPERSRTRSSR